MSTTKTASTSSAISATPPRTLPWIPRGLATLARTEAKLFTRDIGGLFFAVAFPSILVLGMGYVIPGLRDPVQGMGPAFDGLLVIHIFMPAILSTAIATVGLTTLPSYLASYREQGIFRRLATTPMRPGGVLYAHLVISAVCLILAVTLALTLGTLLHDVPMPQRPLLAALAFIGGAGAMLGLGLLIGGLAPKASSASGIGMLIYFPMLFFAGLWTPGPLMPDTLSTISTFTPLGAASQAMSTAWFGEGVPLLQLLVLGGYSVVLFTLASRVFKWS